MRRRFLRYSLPAIASICLIAVIAITSFGHARASPGGVIVSDQNDCTVGPTNDNFLSAGQTAYVWLLFNNPTTVKGYTYEITGTNSDFDSGILKIRFTACRKGFVNDFLAKFTTPTTPGEY